MNSGPEDPRDVSTEYGGHFEPERNAWVLVLAAQGLSLSEIAILTGIGKQWAGRVIQTCRRKPTEAESVLQRAAGMGWLSTKRAHQTAERFRYNHPALDEAKGLPPAPRKWLERN